MIKSISINSNIKQIYAFDENQKHKLSIDLTKINLSEQYSFDIEIIFEQPIFEFRNHDYKWVKCDKDITASEFCPKIIKLQNGQLVQSNIHFGIWEISKKRKNVLLWRFNPNFSQPITVYSGNSNRKVLESSKKNFDFPEHPALLFPKNHALEFSRSKYPFTAIACFTDHCDFDTAENLSLQRMFFKENRIKITKGFFLNHFSKRTENASFENDRDELMKWKLDGHELCYHSLSQSIKTEKQSYEDFIQFTPPLDDLKVWIDHGFQPYNFSLLEKNILNHKEYEKILVDKKINVLWNYIDSGTATNGVINQLNTKHFTLRSFLNGNKDVGLIKKMQLMIKNIIFHFYNDENIILKYKNSAGNFKKAIIQRQFKFIFPFFRDFLSLGFSVFSILIFWKKVKNKPYKLAKYSPILFKHIIAEKEFYIFQTLEMLDFKKSLSKSNLNILMNEKGVFIAHTYFSVPMEYHIGRMFSDDKRINADVSANFKFLGEKIKNNEIWNPTLSELIEYWQKFEKIVLDIKPDQSLFLKTDTDLIIREIY
ncbi:hypothetical protein LPB248_14725 [Flavobacterium sp. LPB0248]|uniref:hypothetical protein n=1 Tax=Flavobacterium sp. LPB0248 TaxID=2614441 RepID=UPI0015A60E6B|nr:hypothetical protein [Flavobacterium sp. LPB0248]QLC67512.1 hypothetical protein LPB248_14725 [Flavobacterium sp. LPB0248]